MNDSQIKEMVVNWSEQIKALGHLGKSLASVRIGKGDCEHSEKRGEAVGEEFVSRAADTDADHSGLGESLDNMLSIWAGFGGRANRYSGGGKVWVGKQRWAVHIGDFHGPHFLTLSSLYLS